MLLFPATRVQSAGARYISSHNHSVGIRAVSYIGLWALVDFWDYPQATSAWSHQSVGIGSQDAIQTSCYSNYKDVKRKTIRHKVRHVPSLKQAYDSSL